MPNRNFVIIAKNKYICSHKQWTSLSHKNYFQHTILFYLRHLPPAWREDVYVSIFCCFDKPIFGVILSHWNNVRTQDKHFLYQIVFERLLKVEIPIACKRGKIVLFCNVCDPPADHQKMLWFYVLYWLQLNTCNTKHSPVMFHAHIMKSYRGVSLFLLKNTHDNTPFVIYLTVCFRL